MERYLWLHYHCEWMSGQGGGAAKAARLTTLGQRAGKRIPRAERRRTLHGHAWAGAGGERWSHAGGARASVRLGGEDDPVTGSLMSGAHQSMAGCSADGQAVAAGGREGRGQAAAGLGQLAHCR